MDLVSLSQQIYWKQPIPSVSIVSGPLLVKFVVGIHTQARQLHKSNDPPRPRSPHHRALNMHRPTLAINRPLDRLLPAYHCRRTLDEGPGLGNLGLVVGGLGVGGG